MSQLEQVRQMCMAIVSKHVNAGVMRSVEATTRADTAKLIAAEIAALELPTASYKQYGYAVLLRSQINEPLPTFDSIWAEYTVAQDHIKEQIQILLDNGESSEECDLVAVPVYAQAKQPEKINQTIELDEATKFILGLPNFVCAKYARQLRKIGKDIPHEHEKEQAFVIHWLLNLYFEHGDNWKSIAVNELSDDEGAAS